MTIFVMITPCMVSLLCARACVCVCVCVHISCVCVCVLYCNFLLIVTLCKALQPLQSKGLDKLCRNSISPPSASNNMHCPALPSSLPREKPGSQGYSREYPRENIPTTPLSFDGLQAVSIFPNSVTWLGLGEPVAYAFQTLANGVAL